MAQFPGMTSGMKTGRAMPGMMAPKKTQQPPWGKGAAAPPFRARPGIQPPMPGGGGKPPMMADGGAMGSPAPIGGMDDDSAMPPPAAGAGPDPDHDQDVDNPVIKPESVNYHDDPHSCQTCQYMGTDGQCSVLKMQVSPEGGCNAFEAKAGGGDEGMMPGEDAGDTGMGTSGGQQ